MPNYALIKNSIVENIVVWDGSGDIFSDYITVNIDNVSAGIGWSYDGEAFTSPPELTLPATQAS